MDVIRIENTAGTENHEGEQANIVCIGEIVETSETRSPGTDTFNTIFSYDSNLNRTVMTVSELTEISEADYYDTSGANFKINKANYSVSAHKFCEATFIPSLTFNASTKIMGISNVADLKKELFKAGLFPNGYETWSSDLLNSVLNIGTKYSLFDIGIIYRGPCRRRRRIDEKDTSFKIVWCGVASALPDSGYYPFSINFDTGEIINSNKLLERTRRKPWITKKSKTRRKQFFGLIFRWRATRSANWIKSRRSFNAVIQDAITRYAELHYDQWIE